ncbi:hypothetical protein BD311DRAFT_748844 [Dichomitus squalens]|uniref:Uncharacterized protein n=1 Tax=Dichomitus squalens TaxID=114155 RepID=A0A4V2K1N8_9APHY|nr:hypothetical protein BD311DRAFT_748844 [Dichomitus squalens]
MEHDKRMSSIHARNVRTVLYYHLTSSLMETRMQSLILRGVADIRSEVGPIRLLPSPPTFLLLTQAPSRLATSRTIVHTSQRRWMSLSPPAIKSCVGSESGGPPPIPLPIPIAPN